MHKSSVVLLFLLLITIPCSHGAYVNRKSPVKLFPSSPIISRKMDNTDDATDKLNGERRKRDTGPTSSNESLLHHRFVLVNDSNPYAVIYWSGLQTSQIILIATFNYFNGQIANTQVYRSTDYGLTFEKQNSKFKSNVVMNLFDFSTANKKLLVLGDSTNDVLYLSKDEGETYTVLKPPFNISTLNFYPNSDIMYVLDYTTNKLWRAHYGQKFTVLLSNVYTFVEGTTDDEIRNRIIYFIEVDANKASHLYGISLTATDESSKVEYDHNLNDFNPSSLWVYSDYIYLIQSENRIMEGDIAYIYQKLLVSYKRSAFTPVQFSSSTFPQRPSYIIKPVHMQQTLIMLSDGPVQTGDLYLSDSTGKYFTKSLDNVLIDESYFPYADVHVLNGINGTMLANQWVGDYTRTKMFRTLVTYNAGGDWSLLYYPYSTCFPPNCSLHLLMDVTAYHSNTNELLSLKSSVGIVSGVGNIGPSYTFTRQSLNTANMYISQDGAKYFRQTLDNSWQLAYCDFGAVITAVADFYSEKSNNLFYSINEGQSWVKYYYHDSNISVGGIVTEPGETTRVVTIFGYASYYSDWEIITINYSKILNTPCQEQDYLYWSPYDDRVGRQCLLGSKVVFERKNPDSKCFNGLGYVREVSSTPCSCTIDDYECDFGYKHSELYDQFCVYDSSQSFTPPTQCTSGSDNYTMYTGYRKIAGDACVGGDSKNYESYQVKCNKVSNSIYITTDPQVVTDNTYVLVGSTTKYKANGNLLSNYSNYIWDFGHLFHHQDRGLMEISYTYLKTGSYTIYLTIDGKLSAMLNVVVVQRVVDSLVTHHYGLEVGEPGTFEVILTGQDGSILYANGGRANVSEFGYLQFRLCFNMSCNDSISTDSFTFEHVYYFPGEYNFKLHLFGPFNNEVTVQTNLSVFDVTFVIELGFDNKFISAINNKNLPSQFVQNAQNKLKSLLIKISLPQTINYEINPELHSNVIYISFDQNNKDFEPNTILNKLQDMTNSYTLNIVNYNGNLVNVRDVTDYIHTTDKSSSPALVGAVVVLVIIVLLFALTFLFAVIIIVLLVRLGVIRGGNRNQPLVRRTQQGQYLHIQNTEDDDMIPLGLDTDDDDALLSNTNTNNADNEDNNNNNNNES